jgi:hypothetical protein
VTALTAARTQANDARNVLVYYLRRPACPSVRIFCYDAATLAGQIHKFYQLADDREVRLDLDPQTLRPTGLGRVTTLDQRVVFEFTVAIAGRAAA